MTTICLSQKQALTLIDSMQELKRHRHLSAEELDVLDLLQELCFDDKEEE